MSGTLPVLRLGTVLAVLAFVSGAASLHAQESADTVLFNGKIVTVDAMFTLAEAVAIRGERIAAVGSDEEILEQVGPDTRRVDLAGRTVIPGLIDNHNHVIRATEYWPNEARLDGVTSRLEALSILDAKARSLPDGEWLMSLGGWTEEQFIGNADDFTRLELDGIARDRPAFVQATYDHAYGNSAWFNEMDIPIRASFEERSNASGLSAYVVRDETGEATGRLNGGMPMVIAALEHFPVVTEERQSIGIRQSLSYLNSIGLTAIYDPAGMGIKRESYARIQSIADEAQLTVRIFHTLSRGVVPSTPDEARGLIGEIEAARPFQGDHSVDMISIGESYYAPFHRDNLFDPTMPTAEDLSMGRAILTAAAEGGWSAQTHSSQPETIDTLLDVVNEVNAEYPMRQLRWTITHADLIGRAQVERMRELGMTLQMRSLSTLFQPRRAELINQMGEDAYRVPPLRMIQDSGIPWGLGTDGTKASQINPFVTLWWAVTGLALNGNRVLNETLTREEALIAHTRSNAYLMFQEGRIGSIRPGLMADLLVLDRDYLTVPDNEIKEISPLATMVGGEVVYGEL
ncbi:MAG: amidohydrolase [Gammaproteobacteria bacterium]